MTNESKPADEKAAIGPFVAKTYWLIEYRDRTLNQTTGYVKDIVRDDDYVVVITKKPEEAIKFSDRASAQIILDDASFIHAMGSKHPLVVEEHIFYE
jgi:hypothetical protein